MARPKADSNFFKTWSSDMAYILGFIATDGCLVEHENGYHALNITNKNKNILERILTAMHSDHKISIKSRGGVPKKKYFQLQIRNQFIYKDLLKLGLTPRKSKTLKLPGVPSKFFNDFIRGCFDGDGSVTVWRDPRWKNPWQIRTVFSSGSCVFLQEIQQNLHRQAGLSMGSIQYLIREYELCYSISDSVKLYNYMYNEVSDSLLYLEYKLKKFNYFKEVRPDCFKN